MSDGFEELTRIIWKPGPTGEFDRQVYINRTEMTFDELHRSSMERQALIRGMMKGGAPLLDGMDKLFGDIDPALKEAIERARRMERRG